MQAGFWQAIMLPLQAFQPLWAGTLGLGIWLEDSDLDIICSAPDLDSFQALLNNHFDHFPDFASWRRPGPPEAVVARFRWQDLWVEIYAETGPSYQQRAYRHFVVEARLLRLGGQPLAQAVRELKKAGTKTEPAFTELLGLSGDPYRALLELEDYSDQQLADLVSAAMSPMK